mgnify:FL=1|jgi:pimeloyl-ACP methyl ester carboxylesterase
MNNLSSIFEVDDRRLAYQCVDPQSKLGKPEDGIVLLHEGLGSIELWKNFPKDLAEVTGCRVFVYSRYGYGSSTALREKRTTDYMHEEALTILPKFLEYIGVERPILIGHSDGASISLIHNGGGYDVSGLVLLAPHVFVEELTVNSIQAARVAFENTGLPKKLARYHENVESAFWGWNDIWLSREFQNWNIETYVKKLTSESLLIQSADDPYGTLAQIEAIEKLSPAPTQRMILEDCGHSPHVDHPNKTLDSIGRFVRDCLDEVRYE